jgi:hypothetical protein
MSTKNNPGAYDCYAKLEPDEPYFLLRGKDPVSWLLVNLWIMIRRHMAGPDEITPEYQAKLNEAKRCSDSMKIYAQTHPANKGTRSIENAVKTFELLK